MSTQYWTKAIRNDILRRMAFAGVDTQRIAFNEMLQPELDVERMERAWLWAERCFEEYQRGLHWVFMSCCPYCATPLEYSFDPFDMDGDWWAGIRAPVPPSCSHFCFLRGAVHYNGFRAPARPLSGVALPGPEVPYVILEVFEWCVFISPIR